MPLHPVHTVSDVLQLLLAVIGGSALTATIVILAVLKNPEKVEIWVSWLWRGLRYITKKAEYGYVAADVSGNLNAHLRKHLSEEIEGISIPRIAIRWTNSAQSISAESPGTLIVRMHPHQDRSVNILNASMAVTPRIVVPTIRSQLLPEQSQSIDLQLCRRLAQETSATAVTSYRLSILDPAIANLPGIVPILEEFQGMDLAGIFLSIFLQELTKLAAQFGLDQLPGLAQEVSRFSKFLQEIGQRSPGDQSDLSFIGQYIKVNILLVARAETRAKGIGPYRARVTMELARGADSFYVMATETNIGFAGTVVDALDSDMRLVRHKARHLNIVRGVRHTKAVIVAFERNASLATGEHFRRAIADQALHVGSRGKATVLDVRPDYALCDMGGIQGTIRIGELDWRYTTDCGDLLSIGDVVDVEIIGIDRSGGEVDLSRKATLEHPLSHYQDTELVGKRVSMVVDREATEASNQPYVLGHSLDSPEIPVKMYWEELNWGAEPTDISEIVPEVRLDVIILRVERSLGYCIVSHKRIAADKWEVIRDRYPRGKALMLKAVNIDSKGVSCEVEPGLTGFIPSAEFRQAGYEYTDFEHRIRLGDTLHVYVTRAVAGQRERLNLGLQRNIGKP